MKYIAFLRGINVGKIRIKMTDLKSAFESMGCREVRTYLQTGNVVFESNKAIKELKSILESGLSDAFKYEAYVLLYAFNELADIIAKYPMQRDEVNHAYVLFIENDTAFEEIKANAQNLPDEANNIAYGNQVIYWKTPVGQTLDSPFSKLLAKPKYKSTATMRNLNTLEKMA
ncbi:MAG: DUF1697 domain-containing protein [Saprospiraceae bacterium]|nr:DUF1697 domain-containing protein [Saprospiraceae bacterium]